MWIRERQRDRRPGIRDSDRTDMGTGDESQTTKLGNMMLGMGPRWMSAVGWPWYRKQGTRNRGQDGVDGLGAGYRGQIFVGRRWVQGIWDMGRGREWEKEIKDRGRSQGPGVCGWEMSLGTGEMGLGLMDEAYVDGGPGAEHVDRDRGQRWRMAVDGDGYTGDVEHGLRQDREWSLQWEIGNEGWEPGMGKSEIGTRDRGKAGGMGLGWGARCWGLVLEPTDGQGQGLRMWMTERVQRQGRAVRR